MSAIGDGDLCVRQDIGTMWLTVTGGRSYALPGRGRRARAAAERYRVWLHEHPDLLRATEREQVIAVCAERGIRVSERDVQLIAVWIANDEQRAWTLQESYIAREIVVLMGSHDMDIERWRWWWSALSDLLVHSDPCTPRPSGSGMAIDTAAGTVRTGLHRLPIVERSDPRND